MTNIWPKKSAYFSRSSRAMAETIHTAQNYISSFLARIIYKIIKYCQVSGAMIFKSSFWKFLIGSLKLGYADHRCRPNFFFISLLYLFLLLVQFYYIYIFYISWVIFLIKYFTIDRCLPSCTKLIQLQLMHCILRYIISNYIPLYHHRVKRDMSLSYQHPERQTPHSQTSKSFSKS